MTCSFRGQAGHGRVDHSRNGHERQFGADRGAVRVIELGPDEAPGGRVEVGIDPSNDGSAIGELHDHWFIPFAQDLGRVQHRFDDRFGRCVRQRPSHARQSNDPAT